MGTLYLVATPIGNLEDITLRAIRILGEVDLIAAEDTRTTRKLLVRHGISTPTTSYHEHNRLAKLDRILAALAEGDVALVSEAGTPAISDPGIELVQAALEAGIQVVSVPGPSAITAALAASGLATDRFAYLGFLPRKPRDRRDRLEWAAPLDVTLVAFEAPHRLLDALADIRDVLGDREMAAAREISKLHEEVVRGSVSRVLGHFQEHPPRGELTLVISGAEKAAWSEAQVVGALEALLADGVSGKEASVQVAKRSGWPRGKVYDLWLQSRGNASDGSR